MRWIVRGLTALAALLLLVVVVVYAGSEWVIRQGHAVPTVDIAVPKDAASLAEGARVARLASCRDCHGPNGEGKVLFEDPMLGRIAPPSLARAAATMTDAELARAIRHGVKKDGSSLFIMPIHAIGHLSDEDVGRVIAWIRTLRPGPKDTQATMSYGPIGRALILAGKLPAMATASTVSQPRRPADMGRYVVDFACTACHKLHQAGTMEDGSTRVPALAPVVAAYDPARLRKLLRTGVGTRPDHGIMSVVARESFSVLTDGEIAAIQAYLKAEAIKAPPQ
ncbi:cytochrome c553 [Sphingomonas naasensis]|uniref:C-type cytochrome n=1 Tax=Sphingomonas naasensis TaxID=1344951 RepID=A0A4S1W8E6_9SPHN|nr:c-type cytochrome [Sphingomonas naasensis]NIJ19419.1 cytochrome c553 [Sphingomonas naasensis]TGX39161.1 c-type cytochrome [Sphingomonas naasensis]